MNTCYKVNPVVDGYEKYLTTYIGNSPKVALLLDYDGTLAPIAEHVDLAVLPRETKKTLHALSRIPGVFVAIISGRNVDNVKEMVGIDNFTYAGNHGLQVLYPDGSRYTHELPANFTSEIKKLVQKLEDNVVRDGSWLEIKGAALTLHFRTTPEHLRDELEETAQKIMEESSSFKVGKAHCALEAMPNIDWHKGKASLLILKKEFGEDWPKKVKVLFVGDDATDEDAMKSLKGYAATFRVSSSVDVDTYAEQLFSSTEVVEDMLKFVLKLFKK